MDRSRQGYDAEGRFEQQETGMERELDFLSADELDAVVGGAMNDGTSDLKWQTDPSPDKLPRPVLTPGPIKVPPLHIVAY
jgi:hypothetical protein